MTQEQMDILFNEADRVSRLAKEYLRRDRVTEAEFCIKQYTQIRNYLVRELGLVQKMGIK